MTEYNLTPPTISPTRVVQEAREKRRKVLEGVYQRRSENYARFRERLKKQGAVTVYNDDHPL